MLLGMTRAHAPGRRPGEIHEIFLKEKKKKTTWKKKYTKVYKELTGKKEPATR